MKMFGKCCQLRSTGGSSSSLDSSSSGTSEIKDGSKEQGLRYQGARCSSDVAMLGEMMFGSVAMSYKGSTLKIHQIRLVEKMTGAGKKNTDARANNANDLCPSDLSSEQVAASADAEQGLHSQDGRKCVRQPQHVSPHPPHTHTHTHSS